MQSKRRHYGSSLNNHVNGIRQTFLTMVRRLAVWIGKLIEDYERHTIFIGRTVVNNNRGRDKQLRFITKVQSIYEP